MSQNTSYLVQETATAGFYHRQQGLGAWPARHVARQLYRRAHSRGRLGQVWSTLTGRPRCLLDLAEVKAACSIRDHNNAGAQTVPIRQIRGSGGRCNDFDTAFRPLKSHNEERWVHVAVARQMGIALPPVRLTQVGDVYFVLDGHHRISVAEVLGEKEVDAVVTVWDVNRPLPWE